MSDRRRGRRTFWLLILGIVFAGLATLALVNRQDEAVGLNEEIRYDDFGFMVLLATREKVVGEDEQELKAEGLFLVLSLKVSNHGAGMVPFQFKNEFATVEDAGGHRYPVSERGMQARHYFREGPVPCAEQLRGGQSCVTELVFEVPEDVREPRLRISISSGAFWKLLDLIFYGDKSIRLG